MSRSKWKGPVNLLRSTTITPEFIGKLLKVHNGKSFSYIKVTNNHVGFKLGEFSLSKIPAIYKNKK